jgi:hypothetical protein
MLVVCFGQQLTTGSRPERHPISVGGGGIPLGQSNNPSMTTIANRSIDICFGHGEAGAHGICQCDDGFGEVDCRGDYSTPQLLNRLWLNLYINIAVNCMVLLLAIVRSSMVLIVKCNVARSNAHIDAGRRHRCYGYCTCTWLDTQVMCLLTIVICETCNLICLSVGRLENVVLSQQIWYAGIVICELAATFFVRFFASVVAKYHKPTLRLIRILDITTIVWCKFALLIVILMPFTDISDEGPVTSLLVALIAIWMIFLLISSQIYTMTVLNTAINGPGLKRTFVAPVVAAPVTGRTSVYTSHSAVSGHTPNTAMTPLHPSVPASPQQQQQAVVLISAADKRRITTLTMVKRSVRGMQVVGFTALLSVALSAAVFVATDATSLYANNNIGWYI